MKNVLKKILLAVNISVNGGNEEDKASENKERNFDHLLLHLNSSLNEFSVLIEKLKYPHQLALEQTFTKKDAVSKPQSLNNSQQQELEHRSEKILDDEKQSLNDLPGSANNVLNTFEQKYKLEVLCKEMLRGIISTKETLASKSQSLKDNHKQGLDEASNMIRERIEVRSNVDTDKKQKQEVKKKE